MKIIYTCDMSAISAEMLDGGFFVGWPNPPDAATHLRLLRGSYYANVAIDAATGKVVGFINAVSDGVLSAYVPLLEVLPQYQGRGIGGALIQQMLDALNGLYMIDISCDEHVAPFYAKFGAIIHGRACIFRNYDAQSGRK